MRSEVLEIANITNTHKDRMFEIMDAYFEGVTRDAFESDLYDKRWVVLLTDSEIHGFSTLSLLEDVVNGRHVKAFFSGDTIVDRNHWGTMALENAWARFVFSTAKTDPECAWYWFLICKGYRTYRYMPVYFKRYIPCPGLCTSDLEQSVLDRLAERRFGTGYSADTGTIRIVRNYRLRDGVGDISERELRDPSIAFFQERNPNWKQGVELACLAELTPDNLTDTALRFLKKDNVL